MQNDYDKGGLKMVDMLEMQTLYYLQWAGKISSGSGENWTFIQQWHFSQVLVRNTPFEFNCRAKNAKYLHAIKNDFWENVVRVFLDNKILLDSTDIMDTNFLNHMIFNNKCILYKGNTLYFKAWKQKGIEQIKDIVNVDEKRFLTIDEIKNILGNQSASSYFEYNALINAIPAKWKESICSLDTTNVLNEPTQEIIQFNVKPKVIKTILKNKFKTTEYSPPRACDFWRQKHNIEVNETVWLMPRKATKEVRLLELQWKILQNIYPTNILLHKMKVSDTRNCNYCNEKIDYIEHFFYDCDYVNSLWKYIENMFMIMLQKKITLTFKTVICGIEEKALSSVEQNYVNHILLIGKMVISIAKKTRSTIPLVLLLEYHIRIRGLHHKIDIPT
jgi:hypothetical protein